MGMTEKILKIDTHNEFEVVREWGKYAFANEKLFDELLAKRSCGYSDCGFTITGSELNIIFGTNEFNHYDLYLVLWDN